MTCRRHLTWERHTLCWIAADHAAGAYSKAMRLAPNDGRYLASLGMEYLQQVETDARLDGLRVQPFGICQVCEQPKPLPKRASWFKPKKHIKLLLLPAHRYLAHTRSSVSRSCVRRRWPKRVSNSNWKQGPALTVDWRLSVWQLPSLPKGIPEVALDHIDFSCRGRPGFVQSSLPLFRDAVSAEQAKALVDLSRAQQNAGRDPPALGHSSSRSFVPDAGQPQVEFSETARSLQACKPRWS